MSEILPCPNCETEAEYIEGSDSSVDTIFCAKCPLEVSQSGMSYGELLSIWNSLPRRKKNHVWQCPDCSIDAKEYLKIDDNTFEEVLNEKILNTSNIYKIEWDKNNLWVHFNNGGVYQYKDIPEKVSIAMGEAESAGSFLHQNIKGKYHYEQV